MSLIPQSMSLDIFNPSINGRQKNPANYLNPAGVNVVEENVWSTVMLPSYKDKGDVAQLLFAREAPVDTFNAVSR